MKKRNFIIKIPIEDEEAKYGYVHYNPDTKEYVIHKDKLGAACFRNDNVKNFLRITGIEGIAVLEEIPNDVKVKEVSIKEEAEMYRRITN